MWCRVWSVTIRLAAVGYTGTGVEGSGWQAGWWAGPPAGGRGRVRHSAAVPRPAGRPRRSHPPRSAARLHSWLETLWIFIIGRHFICIVETIGTRHKHRRGRSLSHLMWKFGTRLAGWFSTFHIPDLTVLCFVNIMRFSLESVSWYCTVLWILLSTLYCVNRCTDCYLVQTSVTPTQRRGINYWWSRRAKVINNAVSPLSLPSRR